MALGQVDDQVARLDEQPLAVGVGRQGRSVARQGQAQGLGQAVHRIGREHPRTGPAGRAGRPLDRLHILVADRIIGRRDHGIDQVQRLDATVLQHDLAGLHRPARHEDGGDVQAQRRHQHARRDLVAVADADHRVGAMRVDHVFHRIGDDLARGQRVQHAVMAHGDAVIDRDGVEFLGDAAGRLDLAGDQLAQVLQVDMAGHELGEAVDDGDDRLAEIAVLHACRAPQAPCAGHVAAMGGGAGTIGGHGGSPLAGIASITPRHGRKLPPTREFRGFLSAGRDVAGGPGGAAPPAVAGRKRTPPSGLVRRPASS